MIESINNLTQTNGKQEPLTNQEKIDKTKTVSKDDFMKLFLTQLRMQNPLKPFDSADMLQQMSQLTSLSATEELGKTIKNLNANLGNSQVLDASQLIGKHVQVPSGVAQLTSTGLNGSVILPGDVTEITIEIKDSDGKVIKTVEKDKSSAGVFDFTWDGKDKDGNAVKEDFYQISASANVNGQRTELITAGTFKINSVALNPSTGSLILNVDGLGGLKMNEIIKIL